MKESTRRLRPQKSWILVFPRFPIILGIYFIIAEGGIE